MDYLLNNIIQEVIDELNVVLNLIINGLPSKHGTVIKKNVFKHKF